MNTLRSHDEAPTLGERIIGGFAASFLFTALTAVTLPAYIVYKTLWWWPFWFVAYLFLKIFWFLIFFVSTLALIIGFRRGIYEVMDVFNQIWETGKTDDKRVRSDARRYAAIIVVTAMMAIVFGSFLR